MIKRIVSALVGVAIIIAVLFIQTQFSYAVSIGFAVVNIIAVYEIVNAIGLAKNLPVILPCFLVAVVIPFSSLFESVNFPVVMLCVYIFAITVLSNAVFQHEKIEFFQLAEVVVMVLMAVFAFSSMAFIVDTGSEHSYFYLFYILGSAWFADIGGYFAGVTLGKHKLAPKISPKKTVEGFIGGIISTPLFLIVTALVYTLFKNDIQINYLTIIVLGIITSLISVLGDLTFSILKRYYKIKDYGSIMPGHGGIMDRFDSVTFVAPFLFIVLKYFPVVG